MRILVLLLTFGLPYILQAQPKQAPLQLKNTGKGIFVVAADPKLIGHSLDLYRKTGNEQAFLKIASLTPHASKASLTQKITDAQKVFRPESAPQPEGVDDAWRTHRTNDTVRTFIAAYPQLAYVFNIAYLDTDIKTGVSYQYQVRENDRVLMTSETVSCTLRYTFPSLSGVTDTVVGRSIVFRLPVSDDYHRYCEVEVRRKLFTEKPAEYRPVTLSAGVAKRHGRMEAILTDKSLRSLSEYTYELRQKSIFGDVDEDRYEYPVSNIPKAYNVQVTKFTIRSGTEHHTLRIGWQLSDPQRVQSTTLYRSRVNNDKYQPVQNFNAADTTATDAVTIANEPYFYYLEVTDIFGRKSKSFTAHAICDGVYTPTPPHNVQATALPAGVRLTWKASDTFSRGFYVFRKTATTDFRQVSPFIPTVAGEGAFTDSSSLEPGVRYYYTVATESDTYRKSVYSDTLAIAGPSLPTGIKPPLDVHASFRKGKVIVMWENVRDRFPAVAGYRVYRSKANTQRYERVSGENALTQNSFSDSTDLSPTEYHYTITSVDGTGIESAKSQPVVIDLYEKFVLLPERLGAEVLPTAIKIRWTTIDTKVVKTIKVFRAEENGDFKLLSSLDKSHQHYMDRTVTKGKLYSYRLVVIDAEGSERELRKALLVEFR